MLNKKLFMLKLKYGDMLVGDFEDIHHLEEEFGLERGDLKDIFVIIASYEVEGYDGSAFVLFEENGKLYEVNGSHCSCNGLEGQWIPEEVTEKELKHRIKNGYIMCNYYGDSYDDILLDLISS